MKTVNAVCLGGDVTASTPKQGSAKVGGGGNCLLCNERVRCQRHACNGSLAGCPVQALWEHGRDTPFLSSLLLSSPVSPSPQPLSLSSPLSHNLWSQQRPCQTSCVVVALSVSLSSAGQAFVFQRYTCMYTHTRTHTHSHTHSHTLNLSGHLGCVLGTPSLLLAVECTAVQLMSSHSSFTECVRQAVPVASIWWYISFYPDSPHYVAMTALPKAASGSYSSSYIHSSKGRGTHGQ